MKSGYMSAAAAAGELGISLATLYSYVSRGLIRSEVADSARREKRYLTEDVERLKTRSEMRRDPKKVVDKALHWGTPMLESALTLIDNGQCYYRGRNIVELATERTVEQVAALMWTGDEQLADALFVSPLPALPTPCAAILPLLRQVTPIERFQVFLPLALADDLAAYDFRPMQVAQTGSRILRRMAHLATSTDVHSSPGKSSSEVSKVDASDKTEDKESSKGQGDIASLLQQTLVPARPEAVPLFRAALILCADHELNVSSFTARCVASAGSPPYAVVNAGLAALQGVKHGGNCARVEALFREAATPIQARDTLARRVRSGERVPGFGHPLYPEGDPRGRMLLTLLTAAYPDAPGTQLAVALSRAAETILNDRPNIDFGLTALCAALELPPGTAITLFALGRTLGWIAHAIEEYQANSLIRPRAHYTGVPPVYCAPM